VKVGDVEKRLEEARRLGAIVFTAEEVFAGWVSQRKRTPSRGFTLKASRRLAAGFEGFEAPKKGKSDPAMEEHYRARARDIMLRDRLEQMAAQWEHYERYLWVLEGWNRQGMVGPMPFEVWYLSHPLIWFTDRFAISMSTRDWGAPMTFRQILDQPECKDLKIETLRTWAKRGWLTTWDCDGKRYTSLAYVNACRLRAKAYKPGPGRSRKKAESLCEAAS